MTQKKSNGITNSRYRPIWRSYEDKFLRSIRPVKHIKGENGTAAFLPMNTKIGGPVNVRYVKDKCLTEDQARHIYKKVESESIVNVDTIRQDIKD